MARPGKSAYFLAAALLYGFVLFTLCVVTYLVSQDIWRPYDILSYYGVADPAAKIVGPYLGTQARPFILFMVHLPGNNILSGLLLVGLLDLFCALLVMLIGLKLYGREAGMLAGLLFAVNIAWAQGYFTITEPLALMLLLLSAYALFCAKSGLKFFAGGLCVGAAVCFAPLVALFIPVALYAMFKNEEQSGFPGYIAGVLVALTFIFGLALLLHAGNASLAGHDLQVAVSYTDSYRTGDALVAIADIALCVCMLAILLTLAVLGFAMCGRHPPEMYFLLASLAILCTLFFKEYMNYWLFALPYLALLCTCDRKPADGMA